LHEFKEDDQFGGGLDAIFGGNTELEAFKEDEQPIRDSLLAKNVEAREQIVAALGGPEVVKRIVNVAYPILCTSEYLESLKVTIRRKHLDYAAYKNYRDMDVTTHLDLPMTVRMDELAEIEFPKGTAMIQTEDPAGRKAVAIKIVDRKDPQIKRVEVISQRRRETSLLFALEWDFVRDDKMAPIYWGDGKSWQSKYLAPKIGTPVRDIAEQLTQLRLGTHPKWMIDMPDSSSPQAAPQSDENVMPV
jgi:hypothetical protein